MKKITTFLFLLSIFVGHSQQWAFMKGSFNASPPAVGNTVVVAGDYHPGNIPGNREHGHVAMSGDKIYLYAGFNGANNGVGSDLWVYDISGPNANTWKYITEYGIANTSVVGSESPVVHPSTLNRGATSADGQGNIWIFGGELPGGSRTSELWKYNTVSGNWTFCGGGNSGSTTGTLWPAPRSRVRSWFDSSGNMWIFGGTAQGHSFNDLWKYSPSSNTWSTVSPTGFDNLPINNANTEHPNPNPSSNGSPTYSGSYNGVGNTGLPAARSDYGYWITNSGVLYVFSGFAYDHGTNVGDFWKYDPNQTSGGQWTLLGGNSTIGSSMAGTAPSERNAPYCWKDNDGKMHFFGGSNTSGFIKDQWVYDPGSNSWAQEGSYSNYNTATNQGPDYQGTIAQDHPNNKPGAQICASSHVTNGTHTYMFDGFGSGQNIADYCSGLGNGCGTTGMLNRYSLSSPCSAPSAPGLSSSISSSCPGDAVILTASGCSGGTIHWSNGSTGTSITVNNPGTYTAYCNVSGCVSSNASITINQSASCNGGGGGCLALNWEPNELMTCNGTTTLTAYVSGGAVEFSTDNITWNAPNVGSTGYSWSFPAVNSCVSIWRRPVGCPDSTVWGCYWGLSSNPITSSAPSLSSSVSSSCPGDAVVLSASGCSGGTVHWSNGSTGTSITVTNPGTYTAYCNMSGCVSPNSTITINQSTSCGGGGNCTTLDWSNNTTSTCNGVTIQMVSTTGSSMVEYSTDGGATWYASTGVNNQYTWSFTATPNLIYYKAREVGCSNQAYYLSGALTGQSNNPITSTAPSISSSVSSSCPGDAVVLTATGCSGGAIQWSNNTTGNSITITNPGTITAICAISGCSSSNGTITISQSSNCGGGSGCATLSWGANTTITCSGTTTQTVSTTGSSSVEYSTDGGITWHASTGTNNQYTWSFPASTNQINYLARSVGCSDSQFYLAGSLAGQSNDCPLNSISDLSGTRILMNPNPANEIVTFQGLKTEKINFFRIVSISGKVIEMLEVIEDKMEINVSRFEPGIYMVIFEGEDSKFTNKLIIN